MQKGSVAFWGEAGEGCTLRKHSKRDSFHVWGRIALYFTGKKA